MRVSAVVFLFAALLGQFCFGALPAPQAWWTFDDCGGSVASDSSGNGHDATIYGEPHWVGAGRSPECSLSYLNSAYYLIAHGYAGVTGGGSRTVSGWVEKYPAGGTIFCWGSDTIGGKWRVSIDPWTGCLCVGAGGGYVLGSTPFDTTTNTQHFVTVVLEDDGSPSSDEIRIYIDGKEDTVTRGPVVPVQTGMGEVYIGATVNNGSVWDRLNGALEDLRIYDVALDSDQVAELFLEAGGLLGSGTPEDPYQIENQEQFYAAFGHRWISHKDNDACYILMTDVDLDPSLPGNQVFVSSLWWSGPDSYKDAYNGIFDGNGHVIENLTIHGNDMDFAPLCLFDAIGENGVVKNLSLVDVDIKGKTPIGGIADTLNGRIENCFVSGQFTFEYGYGMGGLVNLNMGVIENCRVEAAFRGYTTAYGDGCGGVVLGNYGTVSGCTAVVDIRGHFSGVGGIVGEPYFAGGAGEMVNCHATGTIDIDGSRVGGCSAGGGKIVGCSFSGNVTATGDYVGGLAGKGSIVRDCVADANVVGGDFTGGLIGSGGFDLMNCTFQGTVSGRSEVGGLIGRSSYSPGIASMIRDCRADASVKGALFVGGLCGRLGGNTIIRSHAQGQVSGQGDVGGLIGVCKTRVVDVVRECSSDCDVTGEGSVGGLIGVLLEGRVERSFARGTVIGIQGVGGLIGRHFFSEVINCYAQGSVEGQGYVGGFIGKGEEGIQFCYAAGTVSGGADTGGFAGGWFAPGADPAPGCYYRAGVPANGAGTALTDEAMRQWASFAGWDFVDDGTDGPNDIWRMCADGAAAPRLSWEFGAVGDFACPDGVGLGDLAALAGAWLTLEEGNAAFNYAADGSGDGAVDLAELWILSRHWEGD